MKTYILGAKKLTRLSPAKEKFIKGLVAELLSAAAAYLALYFSEQPEYAAGILIILPPILQTISDYLKQSKGLYFPL